MYQTQSIQTPAVVQRASEERFADLATVRAYRLAFRAGEVARETGAHFNADSATEAAGNVIVSFYRYDGSWLDMSAIDAVEESFIRGAAIEGYTHGYYGYEPMTNASVAIHFD